MSLVNTREYELKAAGAYSDPIELAGYFNVSIDGAFVATLLLQRSFDVGQSWRTIQTFTATTEQEGHDEEGALYRFYCSAYTSGTPKTRLGK